MRRAQATVETMLLISVIVVAAVAALHFLGESSGIVGGLQSLSKGAADVYAQAPDNTP